MPVLPRIIENICCMGPAHRYTVMLSCSILIPIDRPSFPAHVIRISTAGRHAGPGRGLFSLLKSDPNEHPVVIAAKIQAEAMVGHSKVLAAAMAGHSKVQAEAMAEHCKVQAVQTRALADQASASSYRAEFGMLMIAAAIFMIAAVLYLGLTPLSGRPSNVVIEAVLTLAKTKPWLAFSIVMGRSILFTVGIYSACTVIGQVAATLAEHCNMK